jgi:catechol 2,3-dioxygenase-like lactoylglutathione lyase family enzyme
MGGSKLLDSVSAHAMIGVKDLSRAKEFYSEKLGLTVDDEFPAGAIRYAARDGTWFLVYRSQVAGTAKTTCMRFEFEDIEAAVRELRDRGVVFEEYDLPGLKTVGGIARHERGARGAWCKDPDGNILDIAQFFRR